MYNDYNNDYSSSRYTDSNSEYETEKAKYEEKSRKQLTVTRRILFGVFGAIGAFLFTAAVILFLIGFKDEDGVIVSYILGPMGLFYMLLGFILYVALPKQYSYENYLKRVKRFGYQNTFDIASTIETQQEKIKELEKRVEELEKQCGISDKRNDGPLF